MVAQDYWALSPVIAMADTGAGAAVCGRAPGGATCSAARRYGSKRALSWIAVIGLAVPAFFALNLWFELVRRLRPPKQSFTAAFTADRFALFFQFLIIGATAAVLLGIGAISCSSSRIRWASSSRCC